MAEYKRHQGHRQRMRERVQNYGLDSLAEHEALEYVLYLTNAQKDTNGIAHDLIDRFGDFAAVLEQPNQHHPLHQDYRADGQLPHGKVCMVRLRARHAGESGQPQTGAGGGLAAGRHL